MDQLGPVVGLELDAVEQADPALRPILHMVCALFALWTIQQNMGFFSTFNYMSQLKVKAIWNEINRLCEALRPHARALVDSFGIPESMLAPIAGDWVAAYSYPNVPNGQGRGDTVLKSAAEKRM